MFRKTSPLIQLLPLSVLLPSVALAQTPADPPTAPLAESAEDTEDTDLSDEAPPDTAGGQDAEAQEDAASTEQAQAAVLEEEQETPEPVGQGEPAEERADESAALQGDAVPPEEAPAPSLSPLKIGTHTFSRFELRKHYEDAGVSRTRFQEGDQTVFRARLTFESNPLELTNGITGHVYFAPQASGNWGSQGLGGTIGEAALGIYEGYFMLKGKLVEGKVGRFAMNYGDAGVIGNLDWHEAGRAFDGAHFRIKAGKANVDLFMTQQAEGWPVQNEDFLGGDAYFWGAYGELGPAITEGLALDVYALGKSAAAADIADPTTGDLTHKDGATFMTLGARAKQKISIFDYRVEGGIQVGKTVGLATDAVDKFAYQVNGDVGVAPIERLRLAVGGAVASGDDLETTENNEAYDELYPTTHKWLGLMDVIGFRTNIISANADVSAKITKSTTFQVTGHLFARMEDNGLGRSPDASSDLAGYEIDTQFVQKIGGPAYVLGLYGLFLPNEDHYGTDTPIHYTELQAGLKF